MKILKARDANALQDLLAVTHGYLVHPEVNEIKLADHLEEIDFYLEKFDVIQKTNLPKAQAKKIMLALQKAADILSSPRIAKIGFSYPSTALAARLREAITELKKYTR